MEKALYKCTTFTFFWSGEDVLLFTFQHPSYTAIESPTYYSEPQSFPYCVVMCFFGHLLSLNLSLGAHRKAVSLYHHKVLNKILALFSSVFSLTGMC